MNIFDTKYQIFISSTYKDLIKAREEVTKVILKMYHIPIGMEMFSADNAEQWQTIQETINKSDYYVLIIGNRYGSETQEGISFTEKEFDWARAAGIPVFSYIRHRDMPTTPDEREDNVEKTVKLNTFIEKVMKHSLVEFWSHPSDLGQMVSIALGKAFHRWPRVGWVRRNNLLSSESYTDIENAGLIYAAMDARSLQEKYNKYFQQPDLKAVDIIHCWGDTWNDNNRDNIRRIAKKNVKMRVVLLDPKSLYIKPLAQNIGLRPVDCVNYIKRSIASWQRLILELKKDPLNLLEIEVYFTSDLPTRSIYRFDDYIISADRNFMKRKTVDLNSVICQKTENDGFYKNLIFEIGEVIKDSTPVSMEPVTKQL